MQKSINLLVATAIVMQIGVTMSAIVLEPTAFLQLPDSTGRAVLDLGTATKAAYDPVENFLYVIGFKADVLHVINMTNPNDPQLLNTRTFPMPTMGRPDTIQVCRGGANREYLSIAFESLNQIEKSHLHFFQLLDSTNYDRDLVNVKTMAGMEGFDPKSLAWDNACSRLTVVSAGEPHEVSGTFVDPPPTVDLYVPSFGSTVDHFSMPIVEQSLASANVRQVFESCEGDGEDQTMSSRVQDLTGKAVTVDDNNVAYILFQDNNAIATLALDDATNINSPSGLKYYNLGTKDWGSESLDASYEDQGVVLQARVGLRSLYQPNDLTNFKLGNKTYLVTADSGNIRKYNLNTCTFDESILARSWDSLSYAALTNALSSSEQQQLQSNLNSNTQMGRIQVSKLRQRSDGWNAIGGGYDYVTTFGGRGFSILDPSNNMNRVFDSGDDFEGYFTTNQATTEQTSMYNSRVGSFGSAQSYYIDRASAEFGPQPSAITAVPFNSSFVTLVIANGAVGGLYTYSVTDGPTVSFENYQRRGNPGLSWTEAYNNNNGDVGEPGITDLISFEDEGQKTVVAVSSTAGAISVYRVTEQ